MPLLLNIDSATEFASVCLSNNGQVLAMQECHDQKNHGSFLQPAIENICLSVNIDLSSVDAIAVTEGPGSYTGLRVGMASAKGLCYALDKPLILLNTLKVMAAASVRHTSNLHSISNIFYCPMIDARRMEVFTAVYDTSLNEIQPPTAKVLTEASFSDELKEHTIVFNGSGHYKFQKILLGTTAIFDQGKHNASNMVALAEQSFEVSAFANLAYSEPFYLKEFFTYR